MRAKTTSESPRSIRYLLCADRKLQKLSLRRISVPAKKKTRSVRSTRATGLKRSARAKKSIAAPSSDAKAASSTTPPAAVARSSTASPTRPWAAAAPPALFIGLICFLAAAAAIAVRRPLHPAAQATGVNPNEIASAEHMAPAPPAGTASVAKDDRKFGAASAASAAKAKAAPPADTTLPAKSAGPMALETIKPATTVAADPAPIENPASSSPTVDAPVREAPSAEPPSKPIELASAAPVTVTGCVARDGESFWLTDTSGAGVPSTRSWKSGFLKKHTASLELVHTASALKLANYVGQRVSATGALKNRELQLHSLQRVASSCS